MRSNQFLGVDPRWGSHDRPRKAEMIWKTLQHYCGSQISDGVWVDIGCGNGGIAASLAPRVRLMLGVDPEPWSSWLEWMSMRDNLRFVQTICDNQSCSLAPESADIVICNQVYEHVNDPRALIGFIHRILKPGGSCYFAGPNLLFPIEPHVFWPFIHWLPRRLAQQIMQAAGAKYIIDANSVSYWKLCSWLEAFTPHNALPYILSHPQELSNTGLAWRLLAHIPQSVIEFLTPLSPGFVFILRKNK